MARVKTNFEIRGSFADRLKDVVTSLFGKRVQKNFGAFRPIIEEAIDEGVINARSEFIPTPDEAAELGIGAGGSLDYGRINGAWQQMLSTSNEKVITFTIRKDNRRGKIGTIVVDIDEQALFNAELSSVDTPDSDQIDSIPWMQWMIEGEPAGAIEPNYEFKSKVPQYSYSRTGRGRMVWTRGGAWTFAPVRLGAFKRLSSEVERQIEISIRREIGRVL